MVVVGGRPRPSAAARGRQSWQGGGGVYFDWQVIERWSRHLGEAAEDLDQADRSKPESLDAGPFTPVVMDMVEATVAQYAHLVLRLDEAKEQLHDVAGYYRRVEENNTREVSLNPATRYGRSSPAGGGPAPFLAGS
jgi:hypothetical protein